MLDDITLRNCHDALVVDRFFLIGDHWISGDTLDGWASRPYDTFEECDARRRFAEHEFDALSIPNHYIWICNEEFPANQRSI